MSQASSRLLGAGGISSATVAGKTFAMNHFNTFLASIEVDIDLIKALPRDLKKCESKLCSVENLLVIYVMCITISQWSKRDSSKVVSG